MRIILSLSFLMASLAMQAQSYTITERVCRMWIDNPSRTAEALLMDRIDWRKVGSNSDEYEFSDGISTVRLRDAYLANYPTVDSLINQIEAWIDSCAIPPNLWPIQVCDTSNITINGVVTDAATDASNDGEIAITTYGGQSPYTYAWTGPGGYTSTDEDITGLDNGTYTVTVTDANACTGSQSFEVGIAACDGVTITFTATVTDEVTEGAEDGEIEINTTSGGTGPYTYAWTGPNGYTSTSEDITDLADGDYTVTATDANGCTGDSTFTVGPGFPCSVTNITFTAVVTDESIDQQNDGEIDLTTAGGASPYTWSWRGPRGYTASTEDISNLGDGDYTVTATDANNCQGDTTFTIDPGPTICDTSNILFNAVVVDETIEGLEDGSIDLTTYGGTPPYTWLWRGPTGFRETTEDISNLADGDYTVTVTDNNGCQGDTTYTIDPGFPCDTTNIGFVAVITNASDSAVSDGEIDLTTYGGSKVYTWAWTGPGGYTATTEDITGLAEGEYTVTATDSNNCFSDTTFTVGVTPVEALFANSKSIDLDGSAEYVEVADADNLSFGDGSSDDQFTISADIWSDDITGAQGIVSKWNTAAADKEWILYTSSGLLSFLINDQSYNNPKGIRYATPISTGEWYNVQVRYDGSGTIAGMRLYLNGTQVSVIDISTPGLYTAMEPGNQPVGIGYYDGNYWNGKLDRVIVMDTILAPAVAAGGQIYEMMTIRDMTYHSAYDNFVLYHEYDYPDSTGTNGIIDLSTAGNDGTMQAGEYADLQECITWPYEYQLDTTEAFANITPMMSNVDTSYGGFSWYTAGGTEYIAGPDSELLSFTDGAGNDQPFSICGWVVNNNTSITNHIASKYVFSGSSVIEYLFSNLEADDKLQFSLNGGGNSPSISAKSDQLLYQGTRYFVCGTYDGSEDTSGITLYIDGKYAPKTNAVSGTYTGMPNTAAGLKLNGLAVGTAYSNATNTDVSIYSKELSATEISDMYNNNKPRNETLYWGDTLVAYYRGFNSTTGSNQVIDQSGNNLHATATNMAANDFMYNYPREVLDSAGSFNFDGLSDYCKAANNAALSFTDGAGNDQPFSVSLWVWSGTAGTTQYLVAKDSTNTREWVIYKTSSNTIAITMLDSGSDNLFAQSSAITTSGWNHIVLTYNGDKDSPIVSIIRNGIEDFNGAPSETGTYNGMSATASPITVGAKGDETSYFTGYISNIGIYDRQLTLCEAQELYNASDNPQNTLDRPGSPIDITASTTSTDIITHWFFDQTDDPTGIVTDIQSSINLTPENMSAGNLSTEYYPRN